MRLESQTLSVSELHPECIAQMQQLMRGHYDGVSESQFRANLLAKQWVILLRDHGQLCGFSTQVLFDYPLTGRDVKILFSGDTMIEKKHWGSLALPVAWGRLMLSLCAAHPDAELYWLLTSKGYKTTGFSRSSFISFIHVAPVKRRLLKRPCWTEWPANASGDDLIHPAASCGQKGARNGCGKELLKLTRAGCAIRMWLSSRKAIQAMRGAMNWSAWRVSTVTT